MSNEMKELQCGYEDECAKKNCLECQRTFGKIEIELTLAEDVCIEDFGSLDLAHWAENNPEQLDLAQKVMRQLCRKVFNAYKRKE